MRFKSQGLPDQLVTGLYARFKAVEIGGVLDDAYDILMEGISDRSGDWFPRYRVLCLEEFMAGEVCGLERDHEGPHE